MGIKRLGPDGSGARWGAMMQATVAAKLINATSKASNRNHPLDQARADASGGANARITNLARLKKIRNEILKSALA